MSNISHGLVSALKSDNRDLHDPFLSSQSQSFSNHHLYACYIKHTRTVHATLFLYLFSSLLNFCIISIQDTSVNAQETAQPNLFNYFSSFMIH